MRKSLFFRLIRTDLLRLRKYILQILVSIILLLFVCAFAGYFISKNLYKEDTFQTVNIAFYLPESDSSEFDEMALGMLNNLASINEVASLIRVNSPEEGYSLINSKEAMFLIIVPKDFVMGILDGTNPTLDIIIQDDSDITSYIANELFLSYAKYLGIAQSGVYSALDIMRLHHIDDEEMSTIQNYVNLTYLDRSLNKDSYITTSSVTDENNYSLLQHYMAVAVLLSLFFVSFVIMPLLQGYNNGINTVLNSNRITILHILSSKFIYSFFALYIAYLPCHLSISIYFGKINPLGVITPIPTLFIIALIISVISSLRKDNFTGNLSILVFALVIVYIGGGILPTALLPSIVQKLSSYMPGTYMIMNISNALFAI